MDTDLPTWEEFGTLPELKVKEPRDTTELDERINGDIAVADRQTASFINRRVNQRVKAAGRLKLQRIMAALMVVGVLSGPVAGVAINHSLDSGRDSVPIEQTATAPVSERMPLLVPQEIRIFAAGAQVDEAALQTAMTTFVNHAIDGSQNDAQVLYDYANALGVDINSGNRLEEARYQITGGGTVSTPLEIAANCQEELLSETGVEDQVRSYLLSSLRNAILDNYNVVGLNEGDFKANNALWESIRPNYFIPGSPNQITASTLDYIMNHHMLDQGLYDQIASIQNNAYQAATGPSASR